jgi:hypothetical protein
VELVEHEPDGAGADLDRREPHRDAGERAEDEADQHQDREEAVEEAAGVALAAVLGQPLEVDEEEAAADGELGEEDVEDADAADDHALHRRAEVVDRVVRDRAVGHDGRMMPQLAASRAGAASCRRCADQRRSRGSSDSGYDCQSGAS